MNKHDTYYAVIFTSTLVENAFGYDEMANKMEDLAKLQGGFLGFESARETIGISISYWDSLDAIKSWKQQTDHLLAQKKGIADWYKSYRVRVCKVERDYDFTR